MPARGLPPKVCRRGGCPKPPAVRRSCTRLGVARVACDAQLTALLLDDHGVVVDLGRTRRLFSAQQRRLLAVRDGGCRFPGCDRPPAHTDAHHVVSWLDGGATDVPTRCCSAGTTTEPSTKAAGPCRSADPERGTNGPVTVIGPTGQRLTSHPRAP